MAYKRIIDFTNNTNQLLHHLMLRLLNNFTLTEINSIKAKLYLK